MLEPTFPIDETKNLPLELLSIPLDLPVRCVPGSIFHADYRSALPARERSGPCAAKGPFKFKLGLFVKRDAGAGLAFAKALPGINQFHKGDFMTFPRLSRGNDNFWSADPFTRMAQMQRDMDRTFSDFEREARVPSTWTQAMPTCEVKEAEGHFLLSMDIPGMKKEDIEIELSGKELTVHGERKEEKEETKKGNYRSERFYGSFARTFTLPVGVKAEDVATEYKDGVLHIAFPKGESNGTKQIKVGEAKPGLIDRLFKKDQKTLEAKDGHKVA